VGGWGGGGGAPGWAPPPPDVGFEAGWVHGLARAPTELRVFVGA
jgi:hypothetical protein